MDWGFPSACADQLIQERVMGLKGRLRSNSGKDPVGSSRLGNFGVPRHQRQRSLEQRSHLRGLPSRSQRLLDLFLGDPSHAAALHDALPGRGALGALGRLLRLLGHCFRGTQNPIFLVREAAIQQPLLDVRNGPMVAALAVMIRLVSLHHGVLEGLREQLRAPRFHQLVLQAPAVEGRQLYHHLGPHRGGAVLLGDLLQLQLAELHVPAVEAGDHHAKAELDVAAGLHGRQEPRQAAALGEAQDAVKGPVGQEGLVQVVQGLLQAHIAHRCGIIRSIPPGAILRRRGAQMPCLRICLTMGV
mmetsp:Transcript_17439/g.41386  ORF Transcript_17439/g.41386 Transcript_17439/m.41386 type:complete len:301 (+) Transcript_17439:1868-2770(+)